MLKKGDMYMLKNDKPGESDIFCSEPPGEAEKRFSALWNSGIHCARDYFLAAVAKFPKSIAIQEKKGDKYYCLTYAEFALKVESLAKSLWFGDFCAEDYAEGKKRKYIAFFLPNSTEGLIIDMAARYIGVCSLGLMEEPNDQLMFLINQTAFESIVINPKFAKVFLEMIETKKVRRIKTFIMTEELDPENMARAKGFGIKIVSFEEIIEKGKSLSLVWPDVELGTPASLLITSGSTGYPKGVVYSNHMNMNCLTGYMDSITDSTSTIVLNMNYAFANSRGCVMTFFGKGGKIVLYGNDNEKVFEVMRETNPTIMYFPPIFLHKAYTKVMQGILAMPDPYKNAILKAIEEKIKFMKEKRLLTHSELDKAINPLRQKLFGNSLKLCFYIGASMRDDYLWFFRAILGIPFCSVYGSTEGAGWITRADPFSCGKAIGLPLMSWEVKLINCPEKGYFITDVIDGKPTPRGEMVIRGITCFKEYYRDPEKSKACYMDEGWLHTYDIVELNTDDNSLILLDRVNNIRKMSNGKYIPAELLEKFYEESPYISSMYVYASPSRDYIIALANPSQATIENWAKNKGVNEDFPTLCKNPFLVNDVLADLNERADANAKPPWVRIRKLVLLTEPFSISNGFLTPTYKLRRENIDKIMKTTIDELYNETLQHLYNSCLLYTSPSPRDATLSRMPSSA
eukprot:TRINITY_DN4632_c0_g1_i2.p1 TRINITY_DN4632_c0_g1~~TRINITY_DN4632_c0_g1_i2.p1  ORF type:complete len:684 (+),score=136.03 TRINITY_DN4632_c0_g1_i2:39-2090(+)